MSSKKLIDECLYGQPTPLTPGEEQACKQRIAEIAAAVARCDDPEVERIGLTLLVREGVRLHRLHTKKLLAAAVLVTER